jgi:Concanavalin A-like lectin/glucanases superfamily/Peptide-N-glycosidase F, C terminal/Secretion system C-terminal sorting domain
MSILRFAAVLLIASGSVASLAQDTLRVQTLTFDSITTRRGTWLFPDDTHEYRKVLMHHTLKCDPQTTQDQYNCGEWDYLTYNTIHHHTGLLDSTALTHPWFKVGANAPDSAEQTAFIGGDIRQRWKFGAQVLSVNNETAATIGQGTSTEIVALDFGGGTVRSQYLFSALELSAAGIVAGPIKLLRFPLVGGGGVVRLVVRAGLITGVSISAFNEDLVTVYDDNTTLFATDTLELTLSQPIVWDGSSNLSLDLAVENNVPLTGAYMLATDMGATIGVQQVGRDGYVELKDDFIGLDADSLAGLSNAITITFRVFGNAILPINNTVLDAVDAQGRRVLNIHLPWSDGRVYWDAGNTGGAYDRIDKATIPANVEGQWNDWAFVKNTTTGSMKIYLNGALWHSGTGKTKPLSGITRFRIGSDINGNIPYPGLLDEVNIFNTELSAATIAAWAGRRTDASHPSYAALLQQFSFDEQYTVPWTANTVNTLDRAWLMGTVRRDQNPATGLMSSPQPVNIRPDVIFVQGDHLVELDSTLVNDGVPREHLSIEHFAVQGNVVVPVDTLFGGRGGWNYIYDPAGTLYDSTYFTGTWHHNNTMNYYGAPFPEIDNYEIGRYITPYGIGLSLGSQGFRWTYDVTDYQWLLHDSVELSAGNQQELIDLEFELIEGTPARPVVNHQLPWGGLSSLSYANLDNDVSLSAVTVTTDPAATQWSLRTRFTGHGHNSNDGTYPHCCEWKDNTHYAFANGTQVDAWHIWQENDCALNPVYPQGGTWLGSREGWCPGDLVKDHSIEITPYVAGGQVTLDYDITPVPGNNQGMGGGNYVVNMDLFEYGPSANTLDAEVYLVKRPTDVGYYRRDNPICTPPLVTLRNAGSTVLTSATFNYGVSGGITNSHMWTGSLDVAQTVDVELPVGSGAFWNGDGANLFTVSVGSPNGAADQYADNNSYTTHFELPEVFAANFILIYKTNNRPWENTLTITDMWGNVAFGRSNHTANTIYNDTLELSPGCYTFEFLDTGNDGLSYWADTQQGSGYFRWKANGGGLIENFETEFGRRIFKPFVIGDIVGLNEETLPVSFSVFPNPASEQITVHADGVDGVQQLRIMDMNGRVIHDGTWNTSTSTQRTIDIGEAAPGLYVVTLSSSKGTLQQRVVVD